MKRKLCILLFCLYLLPLFALRSGDQTLELRDVKWLKGSPVRLYFSEKDDGKREYRIAVFLLTNAGNSVDTLLMIDQLARRYRNMVQFAVITPDPESDARNLLKKVPDIPFAFGLDKARKLTPQYMAGSMLYPMAFAAGPGGRIVWNGEAVDLPEFLEAAEKTPVDVRKQQKISAMLDELQIMMRDNSNRKMGVLADRIFRLDPGNAAAMRMRLFVLENSGRIPEAWELIREQLSAAPGRARIYYSAFDMMSRYPVLCRDLDDIVLLFLKNIRDTGAVGIAVWTLLSRFEFEPRALAGAVKLYEESLKQRQNIPCGAEELAGHCSAGALLAARLGDLSKAVQLQTQAVKFWRTAGNRNALLAAEKTLKYFELCAKTRVKW